MNRIKELREEKGYTLDDVAKAIGLANNTISQYENGKREPKLETWQKLSIFFGVSVPYLQGIEPRPTPKPPKLPQKPQTYVKLKSGDTFVVDGSSSDDEIFSYLGLGSVSLIDPTWIGHADRRLDKVVFPKENIEWIGVVRGEE